MHSLIYFGRKPLSAEKCVGCERVFYQYHEEWYCVWFRKKRKRKREEKEDEQEKNWTEVEKDEEEELNEREEKWEKNEENGMKKTSTHTETKIQEDKLEGEHEETEMSKIN